MRSSNIIFHAKPVSGSLTKYNYMEKRRLVILGALGLLLLFVPDFANRFIFHTVKTGKIEDINDLSIPELRTTNTVSVLYREVTYLNFTGHAGHTSLRIECRNPTKFHANWRARKQVPGDPISKLYSKQITHLAYPPSWWPKQESLRLVDITLQKMPHSLREDKIYLFQAEDTNPFYILYSWGH